MNVSDLLSAIESELSTLKQARALLASQDGHARSGRKPGKKRTMSAAVRARIGAATKARWAAGEMGKQSQSHLKKVEATPAKKKHTMSAEARKRIGDAQRKRWAKQRAGKKAG